MSPKGTISVTFVFRFLSASVSSCENRISFLLFAVLMIAAGAARADTADLPNFHPVSPGIYRGAAPSPAGLQQLRKMGVRTVIDLRIAPKTVKREKAEVERLGMKWINLPMGE